MPPWPNLVAFVLASLILIVIPGPSVLFVIGRSLSWGRNAGLLSVAGNALGLLPLVAAVAFGLGAIVAESLLVFTVVKVIGAAYLMWLGIVAIRHRRDDSPDTRAENIGPALTPSRLLMQGFFVGVTNPKTIVFFVAALPQFVSLSSGHVSIQMLIFGAVFAALALISDGSWAYAAGTAREWFASSPRRMERLRGAGGVMMIGLGGVLLGASRRS